MPRRLLAAALVLVMAAGCLVLWLGIPLTWLRIASWLSDTGPAIVLVALLACPITTALWGWALYRINNVYLDLTGQERPQESEPRWLESAIRSSNTRRAPMLLEVMMTVSVLLALIVLTVWFFVFAGGQQTPTGPL